ncbi:MAG: T9SS type A sorting domain-containing protein, partial [Aureispira sp.]|nr:T9SS type A sorting domain-containing protein [Aureispira sp.]
SYDPNDKAAQPAGYDTAHYIYKNTAIDYKIRFQNTGTDTAFNIMILDTLSPHVDIASLQMGASSHNYTWTIQDGNVLRVNFYNIMLPDSNVNEPLSNGFFRYRIAQKTNNPLGTVIENQAAIYFDYNPVVLTNTTFHTVGENFTVSRVSVDEIWVEEVIVKVYPNPFQEQTTIEVEGGGYQGIELKVYDIMGRMVLQTNTTENKIQLQRGNLPQGVYVYRLEGDGELINTGKIIAQ